MYRSAASLALCCANALPPIIITASAVTDKNIPRTLPSSYLTRFATNFSVPA